MNNEYKIFKINSACDISIHQGIFIIFLLCLPFLIAIITVSAQQGAVAQTEPHQYTIKEIQDVQNKLKTLEYTMNITGEIDPVTTDALKKFQKENNLTPDGKLGPETLKQIELKYGVSKKAQNYPNSFPGFWPS